MRSSPSLAMRCSVWCLRRDGRWGPRSGFVGSTARHGFRVRRRQPRRRRFGRPAGQVCVSMSSRFRWHGTSRSRVRCGKSTSILMPTSVRPRTTISVTVRARSLAESERRLTAVATGRVSNSHRRSSKVMSRPSAEHSQSQSSINRGCKSILGPGVCDRRRHQAAVSVTHL